MFLILHKKSLKLNEFKQWLLQCNYPLTVNNSGFHKAKLQGPANTKSSNILPFVTTHSCNLDFKRTVQICNDRLSSSNNSRIKEVFKNTKAVLSLRQPPNILSQLTRAEFCTSKTKEFGIFKCKDKRCKICKLYLQECKSFLTANGKEWIINAHITCQTQFALYYLVCISCGGKTTYCGKTNCLRKRINCHISESLSGNTTNIFDRHVYNCRKNLVKERFQEPFFILYVFMEVFDEKLLLPYESHLHKQKVDTMNQ